MTRTLLLFLAVELATCGLFAQSLTSTTTSVSTSTGAANYGDPITYTSQVTSSGGGVMGGSVIFGTQTFNIGGVSFTGTPQYSFGDPTNYPTQFGAIDVAAADFNADGLVDLAVLNQCGADPSCASGVGTISILKNNGDGTFKGGLNLNVQSGATSITSADINGDGFPDLAVTNSNDSNVLVWFGSAGGTFTSSSTAIGLSSPTFVRTGIFTASGRVDLIALSQGTGRLGVYANAGSGRFTSASLTSVGTNPVALAVGDFNRDGKADVVVANQGDGRVGPNVEVLPGAGNGTFLTPTIFSSVVLPGDIAAADLNGDGNLDFAVTDTSAGSILVYLGKGDGTFNSPLTSVAGVSPGKLVVADLNGDGVLDIVVADANTRSALVLLGVGDGTFTLPSGSATVHSNELQWAFTNVTFNDGGTLSGYFNYNPSNDQITSWNFTTAGGDTGNFPQFNYSPASSTTSSSNGGYYFFVNSSSRNLRLKYTSSLATRGSATIGPINDPQFNTECFNCSPFRNIAGGSVTSVPAAFSLVAADFNGGGLPDIASTDLDSVNVLIGSQTATAVLTDGTLPVASYQVHATYTGDARFAGSTSSTTPVTILPSAPAITASSDGPSIPSTGSVTLRAHVSFMIGQPTGTVDFIRSGQVVASGALNAAGDVAVSVSGTALGVGSFTMIASYSGDTNFSPNAAAFSQQVTAVADVQAAVVAPGLSVAPGRPFTYYITGSNNGPDPASPVSATVTLAPGLTVKTLPPQCTGSLPQYHCDLGFIGSGGSSSIGIEVTAAATGNYSVNVTMTHAGEADPNAANDSASASASVNGADLVLSSAVKPIVSNGNTAYTVTVTNLGPSPATGVVLTDSLTRYNFISASSTQGSCSYNGILISCAIGNLGVSGSATVTVVLTAPGSGWATNEFSVRGNEPDANQNNNAAQLDPSSNVIAGPVVLGRPSRTAPSSTSNANSPATQPSATASEPAPASIAASAAPDAPDTTVASSPLPASPATSADLPAPSVELHVPMVTVTLQQALRPAAAATTTAGPPALSPAMRETGPIPSIPYIFAVPVISGPVPPVEIAPDERPAPKHENNPETTEKTDANATEELK